MAAWSVEPMFDLTSSYFEGVTCPLAKLGYSRDGKRGTLQANWGLLTDDRGRPVAVSVFEGNTGDPKTLLGQVEKMRASFGIDRLVMAGDRGMISQVQIEALAKLDGVDWITALKSGAIRKLADGGALQLDLFDERSLVAFTHEDFSGERLIACRNPDLARLRRRLRFAWALRIAGSPGRGALQAGRRASAAGELTKLPPHLMSGSWP